MLKAKVLRDTQKEPTFTPQSDKGSLYADDEIEDII